MNNNKTFFDLDCSRLSFMFSGYGHIAPSTDTGRFITIVYAIFGIPIFLILLADFGKMFTRGIKFLWAFVRRLYYTGSCRKVRRTAPVQVSIIDTIMAHDHRNPREPYPRYQWLVGFARRRLTINIVVVITSIGTHRW